MARKILKKIDKDKIHKLNIQSSNRPSPQSFCVISSTNRVVMHKHTNEKSAEMVRYSSNSIYPNNNKNNWRTTDRLGHANGSTYCPVTNEIICTRYRNGGAKKHYVAVFDATTLKHKRDIELKCKVSGVAYDRITGEFYTSNGGTMHVFSFNNFMSGKGWKKTINVKFSGMWQDICGFNGIIYKIIGKYHGTDNYIDGYRASDGKYIGSIYVPFYEIESVDVDEKYNLHMVSTNTRWLMNTGLNVNSVFKGVNAAVNANQKVEFAKKGMTAPQAFVATALKEVGTKETGNNNQKYGKWAGNNGAAWCAYFVAWCAHKTFGNNKTIPKYGMAHDVIHNMVKNCGGKWINKSSSAIKPGDLFVTDHNHNGTADHIGIIQKVSGSNVKTIEGNAGVATDRVVNGTRSISSLWKVARPNWPDGTFYVEGVTPDGGEVQYGPPTLQVSPEKLYSSEQWKYEERKEEKEDESEKRTRELSSSLKDFLSNIRVKNPTYKAIPDINLPSIYKIPKQEKKVTKISGDIRGSTLPSTINYVEAPYVNINIGGVSIGTYKNENYPNYITNLTAKKTNGSLNEYTINLSHQISPGDNPNYIDNLISANGYNKIKIEYGDAESGVAFRSSEALLTNVRSNFDFFNNIINYTLTATSSAVMSSISKRTYPAVTEKPSVLINNMLYKTNELLEYFPGMRDKSFVNSNNLIPSTDKQVEFSVMENVTPMEYLTTLVSVMSSVSNNSSVYFLDIKDDAKRGAYFQIEEVKTGIPGKSQAFMYEVDINYPNENSLVYNFSVNEDFAWPLAYEYSGGFTDYKYNIDNSGDITATKSTSNLKNITSTTGVSISDKNWWKNVTEFPIAASLEIKGLSTYILLLNYIKINVYYFGKKRSSSGVYIVTGQEDSLSGNGFITRLDLLRVAGDNQYISIDGRVAT